MKEVDTIAIHSFFRHLSILLVTGRLERVPLLSDKQGLNWTGRGTVQLAHASVGKLVLHRITQALIQTIVWSYGLDTSI